MRRFAKIAAVVLGVLLVLAAFPAYWLYEEVRKATSEDPLVWEDDVAALEEKTHAEPASRGAVVFIGSSSIRLWPDLAGDMAPLPVVQHGFGGAKLADVAHYAERLVNAFEPRAVVVFAGSNDIHPGAAKSPEVLLETWRVFVERVRADLPEVPIYFIGITPSPMRWEVWPQVQATNRLIREYGATDPTLFYIETGPALLGEDGRPDPANYRFDRLHLSARGYAIWTEIIRRHLLGRDASFTPRTHPQGPGVPSPA
jgi:lysophospholipase L1-like esterase